MENTFRNTHNDNEWCDNRKKVSLVEKKKKYLANNPYGKNICCYKADKDITKEGQKACDYILCINENTTPSIEHLYFIELKGSNLDQAYKQISETINNRLTRHNIKPKQVNARIVIGRVRVPNIKSTYEANLKRLLRKYEQNEIRLSTTLIEENI